MKFKKSYLLILVLAVFAAFFINISYGILNIFISEQNLPLELGLANVFGEGSIYFLNLLPNILIWFFLLLADHSIFKSLGIKKIIIFLILTLILWLFGTYLYVIFEIVVLKKFSINLWGSNCYGTGLPIARNICNSEVLYAFYYLNLHFWFFVIWGSWKAISYVKKY